ncbi:MAG: hypothetical protein ILP19_09165 [Oscillospiraceae bacterium]|nr:hypothetical protein [Oscillospiraceae bacterium]
MPYPIITPSYFSELTDENNPDNNGTLYQVLLTPSAVEYVFPLNNERVIRKLMDYPGTMEYKMISLKPEEEAEFTAKGEEIVKNNPVLKHYWNLKTVTLNLMQNRHYSVDQRMLMLNYMYKTIQTMIEKKREDVIAPFIADVIKQADHEDIIKYFETIKPNPTFSLADGLAFLRSLPESEEMKKLRTIAFKKAGVSEDMKNFKYDEALHGDIKAEFDKNFVYVPGTEPTTEDRTYYMEQVMVNYVWTYCMPYADFNLDLWANYIFLNTLYNALKVTLSCYLYQSKTVDEDFVFAVKTFDTALREVKGSIVRRVIDANSKDGLCNNGDMAILTIS